MLPMLLSIIVPIYNVEKYLDKCIRSLVNNAYTNLEIILIDDGSPDNCPAICDAWADKDDRIRVVHKANGGLSDARNAGLEIATGAYCWFVDSDDFIEENAISYILNQLKQNDVDLLIFNHKRVDEYGQVVYESKDPERWIHIDDEKTVIRESCAMMLGEHYGVEVWRRIYNLQRIRENRLSFVSGAEVFAEDILFNMCYLQCCKKIYSVQESLYIYLIRQNSIMRSQKDSIIKPTQKLCEYLYDFTKSLKIKSHFYLIYAGIMNRVYGLSSWEWIDAYINSLQNKEFVIEMGTEVLHNWWRIFLYYRRMNSVQILLLTKYVLSGIAGHTGLQKVCRSIVACVLKK